MRRAAGWIGGAWLVGCVFVARPAAAQGNYRGSPQGGRSALLGGTGVALGRDGSIPFLNPAGLTRVETGTVSFSTNFFAANYTRFDRFYQPGRDPGASVLGDAQLEGTSYGQIKVDGVPSTLCLFFRLGRVSLISEEARHVAALCFGSTERSASDGTALSFSSQSGPHMLTQTQTFNRSFRRFLVGPTYAVRYSPRWSFGGSLHLVSTTYSAIASGTNVVRTGDQSSMTTLQSNFAASSFDLALRLGASYKVDRYVTFGVSAQLMPLHLFGRMDATYSTTRFGREDDSELQQVVGKGSFSAPPPASIAVGIGFERGRTKLETNAFLYFPYNSAFRSTLDVTEHRLRSGNDVVQSSRVEIREHAQPVVDAAIGVERMLGKKLSLLGGLSTDFTANPPLRTTPPFGSVVWSRSSRVAASLGLGSYGGSSELLAGFELSFAQGKGYVTDSIGVPNQMAQVTQTTWNLLFVLAGKTSFAEVRGTVERLRDLTTGK